METETGAETDRRWREKRQVSCVRERVRTPSRERPGGSVVYGAVRGLVEGSLCHSNLAQTTADDTGDIGETFSSASRRSGAYLLLLAGGGGAVGGARGGGREPPV